MSAYKEKSFVNAGSQQSQEQRDNLENFAEVVHRFSSKAVGLQYYEGEIHTGRYHSDKNTDE